ncbi:hypothetical protein NPIL_586461 [Nephila pilipes]|uniref:Uncharacterized protein n=1 Tax=Nephila pilipes TaxID=299642 RepID=A0A8X6M6B5_NEPPI|nr:hypothetical protein NPIL_586461 [Nephila pilipes]
MIRYYYKYRKRYHRPAHCVSLQTIEHHSEFFLESCFSLKFVLCIPLITKDYFIQTMVCYGLSIDSSTKPSSTIFILLAGLLIL